MWQIGLGPKPTVPAKPASVAPSLRLLRTRLISIENVTPKHPHCKFERRQWGWLARRFYPDKARMSEAGVFDRVLRRFQPRLRVVERTERSVANVSAPAWVRRPPDIFIFTFIIRMSCSA